MIPSSTHRAQAAVISASIADQLAEPLPSDPDPDYRPDSTLWHAQALSKGAIGVAVLHGIRAHDGVGDPDRILPWVRAATRVTLSVAPGSGLWFGAVAVAFALRTAVPGHYLPTLAQLDASIDENTVQRLDAAEKRLVEQRRPCTDEFDLVRGLTGIGGYLLHRHPQGPLLARVLTCLTRLAEPVPAADAAGVRAPGWWTYDPTRPDPVYDGGYANLGTAHGIPGPLALLALAMRRGIVVPGQAEAINAISRWIEQWSQPGPAGPWWPEHVTLPELHRGATSQEGPRRPSWCYGTPGVARALQLAGIALGDTVRQRTAETALAQCLTDPLQLARIVDPALCHGWAGVVLTGLAAAADARSDQFAEGLTAAVDQLLEHAHERAADDLPGLILGRAGVALTLHQLTHPHSSSGWQTCLLLN